MDGERDGDDAPPDLPGSEEGSREKAGEEPPPDVPGSEEGDHEEGGGD